MQEEKAAADERADKDSKTKQKKPTQMSGRALFTFDPTLFQDDDDADDEEYKMEVQLVCFSCASVPSLHAWAIVGHGGCHGAHCRRHFHRLQRPQGERGVWRRR